tara:strand:- start:4511 stop:4621 length:111 start_codon:yes stop_codon:yes gene_type:complete
VVTFVRDDRKQRKVLDLDVEAFRLGRAGVGEDVQVQ